MIVPENAKQQTAPDSWRGVHQIPNQSAVSEWYFLGSCLPNFDFVLLIVTRVNAFRCLRYTITTVSDLGGPAETKIGRAEGNERISGVVRMKAWGGIDLR